MVGKVKVGNVDCICRLHLHVLQLAVQCKLVPCLSRTTRFSTWDIFSCICRLDYQTRRWTTSRGCDNRMSLNWYRRVLSWADWKSSLQTNWQSWRQIGAFDADWCASSLSLDLWVVALLRVCGLRIMSGSQNDFKQFNFVLSSKQSSLSCFFNSYWWIHGKSRLAFC